MTGTFHTASLLRLLTTGFAITVPNVNGFFSARYLNFLTMKDLDIFGKLSDFLTVDAQLGHFIGKRVAIDTQKSCCRAFDVARAS